MPPGLHIYSTYSGNRVNNIMMLLTASKCISGQVIPYHKIISSHHWQTLWWSTAVVSKRRQLVLCWTFLKSTWIFIFSGTKSLATLWVQIVLWRVTLIFGCFSNRMQISQLTPAEHFWYSSSREAVATWPNKYQGLTEWCRQKINRLGILFVSANFSSPTFLNFNTFLKNATKILWNIHCKQQRIYWLFYYVEFSCYIFRISYL